MSRTEKKVETAPNKGSAAIKSKPVSFAQFAPHLIKMGYRPIPIEPGTKKCIENGWQKSTRQWDAEAYPRHGVGLLCEITPALDLDIYDASLLAEVTQALKAEGLLPTNALRRVGRPPKTAYLFRMGKQPFNKKKTKDFKINGQTHKVEILAKGQQLVAYGIHPDTQKPYLWNDADPLSVPVSKLPELTEEAAQKIIEIASRVLAAHAPLEKEKPKSKLKTEKFDGTMSRRKIRALLNKRDPDLPYDDWLRLGAACWQAGGEKGLDTWEEWSRSGSKWTDGDEAKREEVKKLTDIGPGTLLHMAGETKEQRRVQEEPSYALEAKPLTRAELRAPVPPPEFAITPLLPFGSLTDFPGAHGTGKSTLALWALLHIAVGRAWCGLPVRQGRVVFLSREDMRADILRRVQALSDVMKLNPSEERDLLANLSIYGKEQCRQFRLTDKEFGACRVVSAAVATATEACRGAVCAVFETAARLHGGDELNEDLSVLADACEQVAGDTGAAFVLIRHVSKAAARGGETDSYAGRGGGAFADAARSVIVLTQLSPEEARSEGVDLAQIGAGDPTAAVLKLTHGKLSHEARSEPIYMLRTRGPRLRHMQARGRAAVNKDRLAEYIRNAEKDGEQYTARDLEKKAGEIGVPKRAVRHLLSELEVDGCIRTREVPPRGKHGRPAVIYVHTGISTNSAPLRPTAPQQGRGAVMGGHGTGGATPPHPVPMGAWGGVKAFPAGAQSKRRSGATAPQQFPKSGAQSRRHGGMAKVRIGTTARRKRA